MLPPYTGKRPCNGRICLVLSEDSRSMECILSVGALVTEPTHAGGEGSRKLQNYTFGSASWQHPLRCRSAGGSGFNQCFPPFAVKNQGSVPSNSYQIQGCQLLLLFQPALFFSPDTTQCKFLISYCTRTWKILQTLQTP